MKVKIGLKNNLTYEVTTIHTFILLKAHCAKKVTLLKWKLLIFKNVIVAKKIFFARPKSANNATK
jgi:hypothetical protein